MIYLRLFWMFFKISLFTIGGGAAMIPVIRNEISAGSLLTEDMLLNVIAISESTPGPIAVNLATFVGSVQAGFAGALAATFGMILPPFLIILCVAKFLEGFMEKPMVKGAIEGVKPVIAGLIAGVGIYFAVKVILPSYVPYSPGKTDWRAFGLFAALSLAETVVFIRKKDVISPVLVIVISAAAGMLLYGV